MKYIAAFVFVLFTYTIAFAPLPVQARVSAPPTEWWHITEKDDFEDESFEHLLGRTTTTAMHFTCQTSEEMPYKIAVFVYFPNNKYFGMFQDKVGFAIKWGDDRPAKIDGFEIGHESSDVRYGGFAGIVQSEFLDKLKKYDRFAVRVTGWDGSYETIEFKTPANDHEVKRFMKACGFPTK